MKKSEYSLKEKRRISKQSEAKLANPPPTGNCDCASLEGGIIGIGYSVENAIVFFKKRKRTVGGIRLCAASLHCASAFLYSFRLILGITSGKPEIHHTEKLSLRFPLGHLIRAEEYIRLFNKITYILVTENTRNFYHWGSLGSGLRDIRQRLFQRKPFENRKLKFRAKIKQRDGCASLVSVI